MELTWQVGMTRVNLVQLVVANLAAKVNLAATLERKARSIMMSNKVLTLVMVMLLGIIFGQCCLACIRWLVH